MSWRDGKRVLRKSAIRADLDMGELKMLPEDALRALADGDSHGRGWRQKALIYGARCILLKAEVEKLRGGKGNG